MEQIGSYYVWDGALFDIEAYVMDIHDGTSTRVGPYGKKMAGQGLQFDPGSMPPVVTGDTVTLDIQVVGSDNMYANEAFEYVSGSPNRANYLVKGNLFKKKLIYQGISSNNEEAEKMQAQMKAAAAETEEPATAS